MSQKERIEAALADRGWTQHELAVAVGVTDAAVSHWAAGRSRPRIDLGFRAAKALGVEPAWLWKTDREEGDES